MTRMNRPIRAVALAALLACLASCQPLGPVPIALASRPPLTERDLGLEPQPERTPAPAVPASTAAPTDLRTSDATVNHSLFTKAFWRPLQGEQGRPLSLVSDQSRW